MHGKCDNHVESMVSQGECNPELKLGEVIFEHRAAVAGITEGMILGLDFLKENETKLNLEAALLNRTYPSQEECHVKVIVATTDKVVLPEYVHNIYSDLVM